MAMWINEDAYRAMSEELSTLRARVGELESQRDKLREALAFYANPKTYEPQGHPQIDYEITAINSDRGKRARAALEECK